MGQVNRLNANIIFPLEILSLEPVFHFFTFFIGQNRVSDSYFLFEGSILAHCHPTPQN
mgnify:CR=1 FL=1